MTEFPPYPDSDEDASEGADRGSRAGRPRWASVLGIAIAVVLVLVIVVLHLTGTISSGGH